MGLDVGFANGVGYVFSHFLTQTGFPRKRLASVLDGQFASHIPNGEHEIREWQNGSSPSMPFRMVSACM
jgi:hypothetical protein